MAKKVLVTGASGFVGTHVVPDLLKRGYAVITSCRSIDSIKNRPWFDQTTFVPLDFSLMDTSVDFFNHFNRPDLLIHLAWEGLPNFNAAFHTEVNQPRHLHFLRNLISNGLKDITVIGTCLEYGLMEGQLSEDIEVNPVTTYGMAKHQLRLELESIRKEHDFFLKWVRLFYVYGQGQYKNSLLPKLQQAIVKGEPEFEMSGGDQERDFLPIELAAEYIVDIATQNKLLGIINCCSGTPIRVLDFVRKWLAEYNSNIVLKLGVFPYPEYEPMRFWGDQTKLLKVLNLKKQAL